MPELVGEHKLVVFSQWETMAHAAAKVLDALGVCYVLLHGGLPGKDRKAVLEKCLAAGLVIHGVGDTTLRILPPVILTRAQADEGLAMHPVASSRSRRLRCAAACLMTW